jgi:hypothetical protein
LQLFNDCCIVVNESPAPGDRFEKENRTMADLTATLKDAAYVTVGLGVLGFQKAQVRRVELQKQVTEQRKQIEAQLADASKTVRGLAQDVDARIAPVRAQVEGRLEALTGLLPTQARGIVEQARATAKLTQDQVRTALGLSASAA